MGYKPPPLKPIEYFKGQYGFLSNFWPAEVFMDGMRYLTVEHAYQAAKTTDGIQRLRIANEPTAAQAKIVGRMLRKRADWDDIKLEVMTQLVTQKFMNHPELAAKLAATRGRKLIEVNTWGDTYWGVCGGIGANNLGHILMKIRSDLLR